MPNAKRLLRRKSTQKFLTRSAVLLVLIVGFQNCSPFQAANLANLGSSSGASTGSGGGVIADPSAVGWHTLKVGASGWLVGMDIAPDGTKVVRADTYGAYIWDNSLGQWRQLVTQSSMPADTNGPGSHSGVYEIGIAPSNTSRMYMALDGQVYRSDNYGTTWQHTAFPSGVYMGSNDPNRQSGRKMAIDPINPDVVYVGTQRNGLYVSRDGGASFSSVSAVPVPQQKSGSDFGFNGLAFDPSFGSVGGKTKRIYAPSFGNGIYYSSDAGSTWNRTSGGPNSANHAVVDGAGNYFVVDADGPAENLWTYKNDTWRNFATGNSSSGYTSLAVDFSRPGRVVVFRGSAINETLNYGQSWTGVWQNDGVYGNKVATDVPALAATPGNEMFSAETTFDPITHQIFLSGGTGVWRASIGDSQAPYSWTSQSIGIEQLVSNRIVVPPGGKPLVQSWDHAVYQIEDITKYPTTFGPLNGGFCMGWGLDYAQNTPSYVAGLMNNFYESDHSGFSNDGGKTWTRFASQPVGLQGSGWSMMGGSLAVATAPAGSPPNIVIAPTNNNLPSYSKDGGQTWTQITNLQGQSGTDGFGGPAGLLNNVVAADRVLASTFYLYSYKLGLFRSTDGGSTWQLMHSGEITANSNWHAKVKSVPGQAGNLFFTSGKDQDTPFVRSTDGGATFTPVANVRKVDDFGFGRAKTAGSYPAIFIVGSVNNVYGVYRSDDNAQTWVSLGDRPLGSLDTILDLEGDPNIYGRVYIGFSGSGFAYFNAQ